MRRRGMGARRLPGWGLLVAVAATAPAAADGKFFALPGVPAPGIPGQRAVIVHDGTSQTMVVDTELAGGGDEVAWVIPTPAPAEVLPVERGVIETLEVATGPTVTARGVAPKTWLLAGLLLAPVLAWLVVPGRQGTVALALGCVALVGMLLLVPALAKAGRMEAAGAKAATGVEVVATGRAGEFEFTVLRGDEADAVAAWLRDAGFAVPPEVEPVLADHVRDGWAFVAGRLAPDALEARRAARTEGRDPAPPHPVALRFASPAPVYPMRLTGVGELSVHLRLIVLGPHAYRCEILDRTAVLPIERRGEADPILDAPPATVAAVGLPAALALAGDASVATRFEGRLLPAHLADDVRPVPEVSFVASRPLRSATLDRRDAAVGLAALVAAGLLLTAAIGAHVAGRRGSRAWPMAAGALAIATLVGTVAHLAWVRSEAERRRDRVVSVHQDLAAEAARALRGTVATPALLDTVRSMLVADTRGLLNQIVRGPMRQETSPGNWTVALEEGEIVYTWHDAAGVPRRMSLGAGRE